MFGTAGFIVLVWDPASDKSFAHGRHAVCVLRSHLLVHLTICCSLIQPCWLSGPWQALDCWINGHIWVPPHFSDPVSARTRTFPKAVWREMSQRKKKWKIIPQGGPYGTRSKGEQDINGVEPMNRGQWKCRVGRGPKLLPSRYKGLQLIVRGLWYIDNWAVGLVWSRMGIDCLVIALGKSMNPRNNFSKESYQG